MTATQRPHLPLWSDQIAVVWLCLFLKENSFQFRMWDFKTESYKRPEALGGRLVGRRKTDNIWLWLLRRTAANWSLWLWLTGADHRSPGCGLSTLLSTAGTVWRPAEIPNKVDITGINNGRPRRGECWPRGAPSHIVPGFTDSAQFLDCRIQSHTQANILMKK